MAINSLPMDSLPILGARPNLEVDDTPGTQIQYLAFNMTDPLVEGCADSAGDFVRDRSRPELSARFCGDMRGLR